MAEPESLSEDEFPSVDPGKWLFQQRQATTLTALNALDDNPDDAAKALELSEATGAPPALTHANLEDAQTQHKAALTRMLFENNGYLRDYVADHPLGASISNDDWGQMDATSQALSKLKLPTAFGQAVTRAASGIGLGSVAERAVEGFKEGFADDPLRQGVEQITANPMIRDMLQNALRNTILGQGMEGQRGLNALMTGVAAGAGQLFTNLSGSEEWGNKLMRDLMVLPQVGIPELAEFGTVPHELNALARQGQRPTITVPRRATPGEEAAEPKPVDEATLRQTGEKVGAAIQKGEPWLRDGKMPPPGVDPIYDQMHAAQAKEDIFGLDDAMKEAQASATRDRAPNAFADFVRQHTGDSKIGIDAEAVAKLYGDKVPTPDDGLLGWAPGIADALKTMPLIHGDIDIPLADWIAKVEPDVAKELHDFIRVRPSGLTLDEAKEAGKPVAVEPARAQAEEQPKTSIELTPAELKYFQETIKPQYGLKDEVPSVSLKDNKLEWDQQHTGPLLNWIDESRGTGRLPPSFYRSSTFYNRMQNAPTDFKIGPIETLRQSAGFEPMLDKLSSGDPLSHWKDFTARLHGGTWIDYGGGAQALIKPTDQWLQFEKQIHSEVDKVLQRLVPGAEIHGAHGAVVGGSSKVRGFFNQYKDRLPLIVYSITQDDPIGTARHEAIHYLRRYGFFADGEWLTLEHAAIDEGWIDKHNIDARYPDANAQLRLEEAIAEEFKSWAGRPDTQTKALVYSSIFEKLLRLVTEIKKAVTSAMGFKPDAKNLFAMIETGEVGKRGAGEPLNPEAFTQALADKDTEKPAFQTPGAVGMEATPYNRILRKIAERNAEDAAYQQKLAEKDAKRRLTPEWKSAEAETRKQVEKDIATRPDIAADELFRKGEVQGTRLAEVPKIDPSFLTAEQKKALPERFLKAGGINPDDVAGLFGYQTGSEMVDRLADLARQRGDLQPKQFLDKLIDTETNRRMVAEHGEPAQNILEEAKEHVLSPTQLDLLHEEMLALATKDEQAQLSITRREVQKWVKKSFGEMSMGYINSDKFLQFAGKAGNKALDALLGDDPVEAFKQKQAQTIAANMAKEALKIEKVKKAFDKTADRFSKRSVGTFPQEYTNFIHDILYRVGKPIGRSLQDLKTAIESSGYKDLEAFVEAKEANLREMPVAEFLFDQGFMKDFDRLTVNEFQATHDSIKTLVTNGRDEGKIYREGAAADLAEVLGKMKEKLEEFKQKDSPINVPFNPVIRAVKAFTTAHITAEARLNRWDRDDPNGIFSRYITFPMAAAANEESALMRRFQTALRKAAGDIKDVKQKIENSLWIDPLTNEPFQFSRRNALGILQNIGNRSNLEKLAKGYGITPKQAMQWVFTHTTKEDWDRAQRIGDLFAELHGEASKMAERLSGVTLEALDLEPIQTPFGEYKGWYNPVKYDPIRPGQSKRLLGKGDIEEEGYFRATTPQGYTKRRTGYIAPVELNLDVIPIRMKQMIHDIAFREAVVQASKVIYDSGFQRGANSRFGPLATSDLRGWLKDVANSSNFGGELAHIGNQAIEFFRQNLIATLIGFNPHTFAKHTLTAAANSLSEVGPANFLNATKSIFSTDEETGKANWRMAVDKSQELQRRLRNWSEIIQGQPHLSLMKSGPRDFMIAAGQSPVALGDMASSIPTWLAKYRTAIEDGATEGAAVEQADTAVRRAHGSSVITNRPAIMRSKSAIAQTYGSLYGFFSHMLQKQYELAWKAKDSFEGIKAGDLSDAKKYTPGLVTGFVSYIIIPALVEELVTPYTNSDRDSWGVRAAKVLVKGMSSSMLYVRDAMDAIVNSRDPSVGLVDSWFKTATDLTRDIKKGPQAFNRENAGRLIRHTFALGGALTGFTNAQEGKTGEFIQRYMTGQERPRTGADWMSGLTRGTLQKRR